MCDGATDNYAALTNTITATGTGSSIIMMPSSASCVAKQTIEISKPLILNGNGTELLYQPTLPATYVKAVLIDSGEAAFRNITGAITAGATTFTAWATANITDLVANDWLIVQENDTGHNEIEFVEWVQVSSVAGQVVTLLHPFRTAFPATHSTVKFGRIVPSSFANNITIRDLRVRTTDATDNLIGFAVYNARSVTLENVLSAPTKGNGIATYRASNLKVVNSKFNKDVTQANEFSATTDLVIAGNTFGTFDTTATASALVVDFGTAYFSITGNQFPRSGNIGIQFVYGVHDGVFMNNVIGWVRDAGGVGGNTSGLISNGNQRVIFSWNIFVGGDTAGNSNGVSSGDDTIAVPNVLEANSIFANNTFRNFSLNTSLSSSDITGVYNYKTGTKNVAAAGYSANPVVSQSAAQFTVTVNGATGGGEVAFASPDTEIGGGLSWRAFVSAANTVTVVVQNGTAGNITPNTANWTVGVIHIQP
jgi:hypothetical protein